MSKYTTQVRFICEQLSGYVQSVDYSDVDLVLRSAESKIFDFDYPIFDENYRHVLNTKILKHYYINEIGLETYALWKLRLNTKMNEIMPYYNQLYKSELYTFNPLYDIDITRQHKVDKSEDSTSSTKATSTTEQTNGNVHVDAYSDTPQGGIAGVEKLNYLTNYRKVTDDNELNSKITGNTDTDTGITSLESYIETVKGKQGVRNYSDLLKDFRSTFLNIDMQVIDSLSDLFMLIW